MTASFPLTVKFPCIAFEYPEPSPGPSVPSCIALFAAQVWGCPVWRAINPKPCAKREVQNSLL